MSDESENASAAVHQRFKDAVAGFLPPELLDHLLRCIPLLSDAEVDALRTEEDKLRHARLDVEARYFAAKNGPQQLPSEQFDALEMTWVDAMGAHATTANRLFYAEARRFAERWIDRTKAVDPRLGAPAQGQA